MRLNTRIFLHEVIDSNIENIIAVVAMLVDVKTITRESIAAEYSLTINVAPGQPERPEINCFRVKINIHFYNHIPGHVLALLEAYPNAGDNDRIAGSFAHLLETIKSLSEDA